VRDVDGIGLGTFFFIEVDIKGSCSISVELCSDPCLTAMIREIGERSKLLFNEENEEY
jgi:hypothetical protein